MLFLVNIASYSMFLPLYLEPDISQGTPFYFIETNTQNLQFGCETSLLRYVLLSSIILIINIWIILSFKYVKEVDDD